MMKTHNIAIIGTGRMGQIHALNVARNPRATLTLLVDENLEAAKSFREKHSLNVKCAAPDYISKLLKENELDGVIVATPSPTHAHFIKSSLQAGKPVLCEKPITTDIQSTLECYKLSEDTNVPLLCGFQRRHDPSIAKIKHAVTSGAAGHIRVLKTSCRDGAMPPISYIRGSGGIFVDSTIHELDICGWMCGSKPISVFAQGHAFDNDVALCQDLDQVVVVVKYENGSISVNETSRICPFGYDNRFEVSCEKSVFMVDNKAEDLLSVHGSLATMEPRIHTTFEGRYSEAYVREFDHFLDVIEGTVSPVVTKDEAVQSVRLVQLCEESIKQGCVVPYTAI